MSSPDQKIIHYLRNLGLSKEACKIYLSLTIHGESTILSLSKYTNIDRSAIYRMLDNLLKSGVIEEIIEEKSLKLKAISPEKLEFLVKEKELNVQELRVELPSVVGLINQLGAETSSDTKVLYYRGLSGIKQMIWNVLKANNELVGYTYRALEEIVEIDFIEEWSLEFVNRNLKARDLYSSEWLKSRNEFPERAKGHWETWQSRFISPKILNINHQLDIYNDVLALYNWHKGEVFGVEIYNDKIASMQKQIFEVLWKMGRKQN